MSKFKNQSVWFILDWNFLWHLNQPRLCWWWSLKVIRSSSLGAPISFWGLNNMKIMTFTIMRGNVGTSTWIIFLVCLSLFSCTPLKHINSPQFYHLLTYKLGLELRHYIFKEKFIFWGASKVSVFFVFSRDRPVKLANCNPKKNSRDAPSNEKNKQSLGFTSYLPQCF